MKKTLVALAAIGLAIPAVPAVAQGQSLDIPYADLNLATPEGQDQLDRRIEDAARKVCGGDRPVTSTRIKSRANSTCVASVKKQAKAQIASIVEERRLGG